MDSTYVGSYGRLKVYGTDFLDRGFMDGIASMDRAQDVSSSLYSTVYKEDYDALSAIYKDPELTQMAINRHLMRMNKLALFACPPMAKNAVLSYLSKWDVENIKTVISSKFLSHSVGEAEVFLLSFRNVPLGMIGSLLVPEDYKNMMAMSSIEAIVNYLTRFGYGSYMMQHMEDYRKTGDVSPVLYSLDRYYYSNLIENVKFYNGDEGPVLGYIRSEIDMNNLTVILKAKSLDLDYGRIASNLVPYGNIPVEKLSEVYSSGNVSGIVDGLRQYFDLEIPKKAFLEDGNVYHFYAAIKKAIYIKYIDSLSSLPLSLDSLFYFILRAESERNTIRAIYLSKIYGLGKDRIYDLSDLV